MESTVSGFVRGVVILAFVLGLPAIALFGVPDEVRALLESEHLPWNAAASAPAANAAGEAAIETPFAQATATNQELSPPTDSYFARTGSIRAAYESEQDGDPASQIALASAEARVLHRPMYRPQATDDKAEVVRHVPTAETQRPQASANATSDASVVLAIESQLRQLGALNYQLQQQTGSGNYRFVCLCANDRGERRSFEGTNHDRIQAMQTVLDDVTRWRKDEVFSFFISGGR